MINKIKNPYFWVSIVALFFASAQIDVESLTTWSILQQKLIEFIKNPYLVGVFIVALIGVYNDNSTPKLDKLK